MDKQQIANLLHIQKASRENRLVIFVGAGVSANSGIPTWNQLIEKMKQEMPDSIAHETDALKLAQLYKDSRGHKEYMDKVKEVLLFNKAVPNKLHKRILELNPTHIITTNYDDLIEQELSNEFLQFDVIREDKDIPLIATQNALIKMHGDFATDNIVLTESDYLNYKNNFPLIRAYVQALFASKLVLFVGFSFADLNLKMILNELHNILSENMQRAYLLSCEEPEDVTKQYFEKKGINILYFSDDDVKTLNGKEDPYGVDDNKRKNIGRHTDRILFAIKNYSANSKEDLASYLYDKITPYLDELRCFGDGLKYFFPNRKGLGWNTHSRGLQTYLDYFKNLATQLKSDQAKRKFLREHPAIKLRTLLQFAYYNYLFEIDGLKILDEKFLNNVEMCIKNPLLHYVHRFDSEKVCCKIKELRAKQLTYTIDDLELPYILFLLGDAWEAYQIYQRLIPLYWEKQKFILYFLCRYNLWAIRHSVHFQLFLNDQYDIDKDLELATNHELSSILSNLPLTPEIKKIFQDMISYACIGSRTLDAGRLKEDIYNQRKSAEKGGCSINSNIVRLLSLYDRESFFSWANNLVWDNNGYFKLISEYHAQGILNSFATKPTTMFGGQVPNSRICALSEGMLESLIFDVEPKRLKEMVLVYNIESLEFSDSGIEYINSCLSGLLQKHNTMFKDKMRLFNPLKNLLLLVSKSKQDGIDSEKLYDVIGKYISQNSIMQLSQNLLVSLIINYSASVKATKDLIWGLMCNTTEELQYAPCIYELSKALENIGAKYNDFNFTKLPRKDNLALEISLLYPITTGDLKDSIKQNSLDKIMKFHNYIYFINENNISISSEIRFKELLDSETFSKQNKDICFILAELRNKEQFNMLHECIDDVAKESDCLSFFISPDNYQYPEKVKIDWLLKLDDKKKNKLFQIVAYKELLKQYIVENELSVEYKKNLMHYI